MKLGFDIDDTLINLREYAFHLYNKKLNRQIPLERFRELTTVPIHEPFGMTSEEGKEMWNALRDEIYFTDCPPFPGAVEALQRLDREGHEIYYITARDAIYGDRTKSWLVKAGFPVAPDRFFCGMSDTEKVHIIRELGLDYYFDDKPAVLETLSDLTLNVYVKDNSYNRQLRLPRIVSWDELPELLQLSEPGAIRMSEAGEK
ncbi:MULTISPECIES: 5' nucleotidase, NT5C type [Cohnella]|uniref:5' nucleotidase, NT5C type n=1 Tax=Cohnella TaxID=329857 RepID=UPI0009B9E27E|nr:MULTISPECIES: HAD hydrolase-like protein [Cohnella]MBN2980393.1 HAD hydrolase-like protein [Cohnella algarum]